MHIGLTIRSTLFCQIAQPNTEYIVIPKVSSERRRYIPIGFLPASTIASDLLFLIPDATLYHFGVLTSNVHNAWTRTVCGRLKSDYRYSKDIVYNNFPWPNVTQEQESMISKLAQCILDARELFPNNSLADLYDPLTMPPALLKAHRELNRAVMKLYGFKPGSTGESECVEVLMKKYTELIKQYTD